MPDLKEIFDRIHSTKQEKRKINEIFKDTLAQSKPYQDVLEQWRTLKAKKQQIETELRGQFVQELDKMDRLSEGLKNDAQLLSDLALTKMMQGETVEITDDNDIKYEPIFKVTFKKTS